MFKTGFFLSSDWCTDQYASLYEAANHWACTGGCPQGGAAAAAAPLSQLAAASQRAASATAAAVAAAEIPSTPPAADGPRGTLIVCPLSVLSNWQMQIEEHTAGNLQVWVQFLCFTCLCMPDHYSP